MSESSAPAPGPYRRLAVNLATKASADLARLMELTGLSQTDTVNRAIQLYLFFEETEASGGQVLVKEPDGALNRLKLL